MKKNVGFLLHYFDVECSKGRKNLSIARHHSRIRTRGCDSNITASLKRPEEHCNFAEGPLRTKEGLVHAPGLGPWHQTYGNGRFPILKMELNLVEVRSRKG